MKALGILQNKSTPPRLSPLLFSAYKILVFNKLFDHYLTEIW